MINLMGLLVLTCFLIQYPICSRVIFGPPMTTESRERFESGFGHFEVFRKELSLGEVAI